MTIPPGDPAARARRARRRLRWLWLIYAGFSLLSAAALVKYGYLGVWREGFRNLATTQILVDLAIGMFLISVWMVRDARVRGVTVWPWLVATFFLGSISPLMYLILREREIAAEG